MDKILTIIIPTYNMERYLPKTLSSLVVDDADLMHRLEVLVVNDGSKDESSNIAHKFQEKYPETFVVIDKENGNYGSCINRGIKEATGTYVKVLDADDSFDNSLFPIYLHHLLKTDADLVMNDVTRVNEKDRLIRNTHFNLPTDEVFSLDLFSDEMIELFGMHNAAYKTESLRKMNYVQHEGISYTDQEWIFNPFTTINSVSYCRVLLYRYLLGREGQTMDAKVASKSANHHIAGAKKMLKDYENFKNLNPTQQHFVDFRMKLRCFNIYFAYLGSNILDLRELIDFDDFVKSVSPRIYDRLEKSSISYMIPYKFIRVWHQNGRAVKPSRKYFQMAILSNKFRSVKWRLFPTIR